MIRIEIEVNEAGVNDHISIKEETKLHEIGMALAILKKLENKLIKHVEKYKIFTTKGKP
jgi:hypothetical protein